MDLAYYMVYGSSLHRCGQPSNDLVVSSSMLEVGAGRCGPAGDSYCIERVAAGVAGIQCVTVAVSGHERSQRHLSCLTNAVNHS